MSAEMILAVAAVIGVGGSFIGLGVTWRRNGVAQKQRDLSNAKALTERDTRLTQNQDAIIKRLDDDRTGLVALNEKQNKMTNHCTEVSTGFAGRLTTTERDIKELKQK